MALFYVDCVSQQHLDETGVPMQGYITCTTIQGTAKPMYIDNSSSPVQHSAHANLDARGYVCIWVDGDTPSHFYLYDSYGRLVNSWLNITCKQGATGPQGPQGATGATGAKGDKGDTGPQGERGLTGPAGSNGRVMTFDDLTAEQKASLKGEQGERGATGATGAQGATGQQGPQGLQGEKGDTGPVGRGLEIDWPCSTKAELLAIGHPQVGDVGSVALDESRTAPNNVGILYVWTVTAGDGEWMYHGSIGNVSTSVGTITFNSSTITLNMTDDTSVSANVPTFNQNTTGTAAKATNAYNDEDGVSIKTYYAKKTDIPEGVELTSNKITAVVSTSTNAEYPSGKAVWDICNTKADDSAVVHKSGDETITGAKTFTSTNGVVIKATSGNSVVNVKKSNGTNNERLNLEYDSNGNRGVWDSAANKWIVKVDSSNAVTVDGKTVANDSAVVHKSGNETIGGVKTFSSSPTLNDGLDSYGNLRLNHNGATSYHQIYTDSTNERYDVKLPNKSGTLAVQSDVDLKQDTLTAGSNITISGSTISATDTTYAVTSDADLDSIVSSLT